MSDKIEPDVWPLQLRRCREERDDLMYRLNDADRRIEELEAALREAEEQAARVMLLFHGRFRIESPLPWIGVTRFLDDHAGAMDADEHFGGTQAAVRALASTQEPEEA